LHHERQLGGDRIEQPHPQQAAAGLPIGNRRPVHLIDHESRGKRQRDLACEPLHHVDAHRGAHLAGVLTESDDGGQPRAHADRQLGAPIVDLALPRQRQRLVRPAVDDPSAFSPCLGVLGNEAAGCGEIHAALRQHQRRPGYR